MGKPSFVSSYLLSPDNHVIAADLAFGNFLSSALKDDYRGDVCSNAKGELSLVYPFDISWHRDCYGLAIRAEDVDVIVHSAGIRGLEPDITISKSSDVAKAETKDVTTVETLQYTFHVNAIGTFLLLEAMIPQLRHDGHPKVIIMGSRGSIGHNTTGGAYAYRASKAALNAIVKLFSVDVPEVVFAILHPSRVENGLVSVKEDGAISAEQSVSDMLKLMERLGKEDLAKFMDQFGVEVPW